MLCEQHIGYENIQVDLLKAKEGDVDEVEKLIMKYLPLLKSVANDYDNNELDEDLLQDLIIFMIEHVLDKYNTTNKSSFCTFLYNGLQIKMNNIHRNQGRRKMKDKKIYQEAEKEAIVTTIEDLVIEKLDLQFFMKKMNQRQKRIVFKSLLGYTQKEISKQINLDQSCISRLLKPFKEYQKEMII